MFSGRNDDLSELGSSRDPLLAYPESELNAEDDEEPILYAASFDELAKNHVKYDTVIWVSISLLLVLAWGIGIVMLLCIPIRRYMLQKDISSRKLYVTASEIVYKFSRPSMLFWRATTIEKCIPLSLVIDIIIEQVKDEWFHQFSLHANRIPLNERFKKTGEINMLWLFIGCLQSVYGIQTFRVESIVHGKAAPVDELQVQGVADPGVLRKVIITEASKNVQDFGKGWKPTSIIEEESLSRVGSLSDGRAVFKSPPKSWKMTGSPRYASMEHRGSPRYTAMEHRGSPRYATMEHPGLIQGEMLLNKLGEVCESVKKMESLIEKSQTSPESS